MLAAVNKFYKVLRIVLCVIVAITFSTMFLMCLTQVFFRFVLEKPIAFSDELCRISFFLTSFYAAALCILDGGHIRVDMLYLKFSGKVKTLFDIIIGIVIILFSVFLVKSGYEFTRINTGTVTSALNVPLGLLYMNIPISGVLMLLCEIKALLDLVVLKKKNTNEGDNSV